MPNPSKTKGNSAERELCKILSNIFNESFIRVPNSGAFSGGLNNWRTSYMSENQKQIMSNDIIPPQCFKNLAIESKFYKDFNFEHLFRKDGNLTLNKWIQQVLDSGIDFNTSFPIICFKINRKGWFCCIWKNKFSDVDISLLNHLIYNNDYLIFELMDFLNTYKDTLITKWK